MANDDAQPDDVPTNAIAIVGIGLRVPGARNVEELWPKLCAGLDLTSTLDEATLRRAHVPEAQLRDPRYVRRAGVLADVAAFDPELFGFTPRDALLMDPQLRHLLERTWESLEDAGIDPTRPPGPIGLFVGVGSSDYLFERILPNRELVESVGLDKLLQLGNDRGFVGSRIAYALDLHGPCVSVQAACASGALAVHTACASLIGRECRVAVAAAASIRVPHEAGYLYEEGGLASPDGLCRAFDAEAQGTLPGSAVVVLTLMRLDDAIAGGHDIYASILASACNNDGRRKVGFAAPSVDGPLSAIEEALAVANVDARSIGFVEGHGTGTPFGDSIEVSALTKAFRAQTEDVGYCVLGGTKPNVGHTDAAAGLVSLVKAALTLRTGTFAPLAHFRAPHPLLELSSSPFRVVAHSEPFTSDGPRRAVVNCLAVGGTNVHMVLEQPPLAPAKSAAKGAELLLLSARSEQALAAQRKQLASHLRAHPDLSLADVSHTLRVGRRVFDVRAAFVVRDHKDAIAQLESGPTSSAARLDAKLSAMARRWLETGALGDDLDETDRRKLHLPTYPFEHRDFWLEPPVVAPARSAEVAAQNLTFSRVTYVERARAHAQPVERQRWLVLLDETGVGERAIELLARRGAHVIAVRFGHGPALARDGEGRYRIDSDRGLDGPRALIQELAAEGKLPDVILHLWTVTTDERFRSPTNRFHHNVERGYFALLGLAQGLVALESSHPVRIVAVSNGALSASGEPCQFPEKALSLGPLRSLPLEATNVSTCFFDVEIPLGLKRALMLPALLDRMQGGVVERVLDEASARTSGVFALRGERVLERTLVSAPEPTPARAASPLRDGGSYLVLGGFGGVGYAVAQEIASRVNAKLTLLGRTPLPERSYWDEWLTGHADDDPVSARIRMVRELEAKGAEVLALSADICHHESMASALTQLRRKFGRVDGVVHAAGVLDEALLATLTLDSARDAIAADVLGTRLSCALLEHEPLAFVVLLGHASRFEPRPGMAARIAASEFAESFTARGGRVHMAAFDLGLVRDRGMYRALATSLNGHAAHADPNVRAVLAQVAQGMPAERAARAIVDALGLDDRQLLIGRVPDALRSTELPTLSRSELRREYVAPEGAIEPKVAKLWAEALGIDRVGATDDFFELGGHSIVAVRLGTKVRASWGVPVPLAMLIEAPTVRALSRIIEAELAGVDGEARPQAAARLHEWSTVVPLQPSGARPPLFCVGGKGGNVMNLRHLATLLGKEQPVFGLQARGVDGIEKPHDTIAAMVDEYVADIRKMRPRGPYLLAGFSGGGAMILEIARQLDAMGEPVAPLLFLDAWNPMAPPRNLPQKLKAHASLVEELGPRYFGIFLKRAALTRTKDVMRARVPAIANRIWEPEPHGGAVEDAWLEAAGHYEPSPYAGSAVLFRVRADRSRGELDWSDDESNGWAPLVLGGIEVIDVPGNHNSLLEEPHVRTLAQSMSAVLDRILRSLTVDTKPTSGEQRIEAE